MKGRREPARLTLTVSPSAKRGEEIIAWVEASNVPATVVELHAPDTAVVSQPHRRAVGTGTFRQRLSWKIEYVQEGRVSHR